MPIVRVGETEHEVAEGAPFAETMKRLAQDAGLSRFRVFQRGGEEIMPTEAPETITMDYELFAFSVAAS